MNIAQRNEIILMALNGSSSVFPRLCTDVWLNVLELAYGGPDDYFLTLPLFTATLRFRFEGSKYEIEFTRDIKKPDVIGFRFPGITPIQWRPVNRYPLSRCSEDVIGNFPSRFTNIDSLDKILCVVTVRVQIFPERTIISVLASKHAGRNNFNIEKEGEVIDSDNGRVALLFGACGVKHDEITTEIPLAELLIMPMSYWIPDFDPRSKHDCYLRVYKRYRDRMLNVQREARDAPARAKRRAIAAVEMKEFLAILL